MKERNYIYGYNKSWRIEFKVFNNLNIITLAVKSVEGLYRCVDPRYNWYYKTCIDIIIKDFRSNR